MKQFFKYLLIALGLLFILNGCGGGGGDGENTSNPTYATAMLGELADANVTIYKIEDNGSFTKLWSETTSSGNSLDEIGKFDMHLSELDDDTFYLYKVVGGKDWDIDDDGSKDVDFTTNKGTIRAVAKGSDLKVAKENFKVTYTSELIYEIIAQTLKYDFDKTTFTTKLNDAIKKVIKSDVDSDTTIDIQDMLQFDPKNDDSHLAYFYKKQKNTIIDAIHSGKIPLLNLSNLLGSYDTAGKAESVTLSGDGTKAYVADDSNGLVVVDISDPANPTKLGSYDTAGYAWSVTLSGDGTKAYVADSSNGLVVIDLSLFE